MIGLMLILYFLFYSILLNFIILKYYNIRTILYVIILHSYKSTIVGGGNGWHRAKGKYTEWMKESRPTIPERKAV